jgi:SWI/SNF-related matrix-associated actin-dependent regulator of chromatin subfamily A-like protein 1
MPHQVGGKEWLKATPKGMLAWQMRVGKTATSLRAWEETAEQGPALVICPATGREMWRREAVKWAIEPEIPPKVQVLKDGNTPIELNSDIVVTNYEKLLNPNVIKRLRGHKRRWGVIIADEAHRLKSPDAKCTQIFYGGGHHKQQPLINYSDRVWPLTGTPIPNHPGEIWTHAFKLWPDAIQYRGHAMELWEFELQYCVIRHDAQYGAQVVGGKNLPELKQRLKPYVNRVLLKDVGEMPHVRIDTWPLDMDTTSGEGRYPDAPELLEKLCRFGAMQDIERFDNDTLDAYLACIASEAQHLATLRRETGVLKAIATSFLLREEHQNGGPKTVVFAHHRDAIEVLQKGLRDYNPAVLHGGTKDAYAEIDRFTQDPKCWDFIGQLKSAGSVHDLSAGKSVVFTEASWTPGDNEQAMFRVLGVKQKDPVLIRFTYLKGSVDEAVNRALARKAATIAQLF